MAGRTSRGRGPRSRPAASAEQDAISAWLRLLRVRALVEREVRRGLGEGLTLPQFDVLNHLFRSTGGMTFVELSRELLVTAGNLTGIVDRLEDLGLVRRAPHPGDRRAIRLTLTPRGRAMVRARVPAHRRAVARLLATLPRRDLRALRSLLGRLRERLERHLTEPGRTR
jgi:DNA-binding MarR family transcriptional regulator